MATEPDRPLFIQSCERSGSTLLRYIVDSHPDICSPSELRLGPLLAALKTTVERSIGELVPEAERESFVIARLRRTADELLGDYAKKKNKSRWCEKDPHNLPALDLIAKVFPDAQHICLYRNCMDVVHSCLEVCHFGFFDSLESYARASPNNLVAAMITSWLEKTSTILEFEHANPTQSMRLKYEALVFEPEASLKTMVDFLGVPWAPAMLEQVFKLTHDQGTGNAGDRKIRLTKKIEQRSVGVGSAISLAYIPRDLLLRMNTLLRQLDYPEVGPDWDSSPSPYRPKAPRGQ